VTNRGLNRIVGVADPWARSRNNLPSCPRFHLAPNVHCTSLDQSEETSRQSDHRRRAQVLGIIIGYSRTTWVLADFPNVVLAEGWSFHLGV